MSWYRKTLRFSMLGNFEYQLPKDKSQRMYDFYMSSFLPRKYKNDKITWAANEAREKLLPDLKESLLDAVFFSICAEIRHLFDTNRTFTGDSSTESLSEYVPNLDMGDSLTPFPSDKIKQSIDNIYGEDAKGDILIEYFDAFDALAGDYVKYKFDKGTEDFSLPPSPGRQTGRSNLYDISYSAVYKALQRTGASRRDFVELCLELFVDDGWDIDYGGVAWGMIAHGWLKLDEAKDLESMAVWIDHIYDLQHNNDTVFNKVSSYMQDDSYRWIKDVLDHKAAIKSPYEIMNDVSPSMRQLALYAIRDSYGTTLELWAKSFEEKTGADDVAKNPALQSYSIQEAIEMVKRNPNLFKRLPQRLRETAEIAMYVRDDSNSVEYIGKNLMANQDFLVNFLSGNNIKAVMDNINPALKRDKEFLKKAVNKSGGEHIFNYVDPVVMNDMKFLMDVIKINPRCLSTYNETFEKISKDPNTILHLLKTLPNKYLLWSNVSALLRIDNAFVLEAVKITPEVAKNLYEDQRKDANFLVDIASTNLNALNYMSFSRYDENFVIPLARRNPEQIGVITNYAATGLSQYEVNSSNIGRHTLKGLAVEFPQSLYYMPQWLIDDNDFVNDVIKKNPNTRVIIEELRGRPLQPTSPTYIDETVPQQHHKFEDKWKDSPGPEPEPKIKAPDWYDKAQYA